VVVSGALGFLIDEDVDIAVGGWLDRRGHDVRYVVQELGSGSKDPTVRQYLRALLAEQSTILITADNEFAGRCSQEGSRLPCLWLRDLVNEFERVQLLADVIEREGRAGGPGFFMEIRAKAYIVKR
jgi:hypothetical protein